jgi:hypothetical protein
VGGDEAIATGHEDEGSRVDGGHDEYILGLDIAFTFPFGEVVESNILYRRYLGGSEGRLDTRAAVG